MTRQTVLGFGLCFLFRRRRYIDKGKAIAVKGVNLRGHRFTFIRNCLDSAMGSQIYTSLYDWIEMSEPCFEYYLELWVSEQYEVVFSYDCYKLFNNFVYK